MNHLTGPQTDLPDSLRRLSDEEGAGSLVFLPDFGGNTIYARPLVAELVKDCTCYAVQLAPETVESLPGLSIEDLARQFAEAIAEARLPRPLHLLGFSFAGVLAYDTGRQLSLLGAAPDMVWLLDMVRYRPFSFREFLRRPPYHAVEILRYAKANWRRLLLGHKEPEVLSTYGVIRLDMRKHPESYRQIIRSNYAALLRYQPEPSAAPTTVLRAMQRRYPNDEDGLGWRDLVSASFQVIDVPGDHLSMLRQPENARVVARVIRAFLAPGDENKEATIDADVQR